MRARDRKPSVGAPFAPRTAYHLTAAALAAGLLLRSFLCINVVSASMPSGVYLLLRPPGQPRPCLALFCLPPDLARLGRERGYLEIGTCPGGAAGAAALLKPIVAVAGDVVEVNARGVSVNGRLLPRSAPRGRDRRGRPLAVRWRGPLTLREGTFLAVSTFDERSWDGRYWGPLPVASLRARVVPLLVDPPLPYPLGRGAR